MIKRIVKLTFQPDKVLDFHTIFHESKESIRDFEGCLHLELLQDVLTPHLFFTLSFWETEAALNNYWKSALFKNTWAKTKVLFMDKPEAWTLKPPL